MPPSVSDLYIDGWYIDSCSTAPKSHGREETLVCLSAVSPKQPSASSIPPTPLEDTWQHLCSFRVIYLNGRERNIHKQGVQLPKVQVLLHLTSLGDKCDKFQNNLLLRLLWMHNLQWMNATLGHSHGQMLLAALSVWINSGLKRLVFPPANTRTEIQRHKIPSEEAHKSFCHSTVYLMLNFLPHLIYSSLMRKGVTGNISLICTGCQVGMHSWKNTELVFFLPFFLSFPPLLNIN